MEALQCTKFEVFHKRISSVNVTKSNFSKSFLRIWLHLLKKSLIENFTFCAVLLKIWMIEFFCPIKECASQTYL